MEAISLWMCAGTAIVSTAKVTLCVASQSFIKLKQAPPSVNTGPEQPLLVTTLCAIKFRSKTREEGLCVFAGLFFWLVSKGGGLSRVSPNNCWQLLPFSSYLRPQKWSFNRTQSGGDWLVGCFSGYFVLFFKLSAQQGERGRSVSLRLAWSM